MNTAIYDLLFAPKVSIPLPDPIKIFLNLLLQLCVFRFILAVQNVFLKITLVYDNDNIFLDSIGSKKTQLCSTAIFQNQSVRS